MVLVGTAISIRIMEDCIGLMNLLIIQILEHLELLPERNLIQMHNSRLKGLNISRMDLGEMLMLCNYIIDKKYLFI